MVNEFLSTKSATLTELKEYIRAKNNDDSCIFLGIFDKNQDKHIGNVKLEPIDFDNRTATFSIMIGDKTYWNKGIGTAVTLMIIDYSFNKLNISSLELGVLSNNLFAIKLYKKVGFYINERIGNRIIMRINKED